MKFELPADSWFRDAKLGIFMHWGIYAVKGVGESWSFYRGEISYEDYMAQCDGFTASKYDPDKWAELFTAAGAKYVVLTSKHHDGVALWDTAYSDLNVVKKCPAGRDLIGPYCESMRKAGLKVGLYFSHLDWNNPDNTALRPKSDAWWAFSKYTSLPEGQPDDPVAWERFLKFHRGQLTELMTKYGDIDLLWFDGDWEKTPEQWRMAELREMLKGLNPNVILNSRMQGYGDYATPEQGVPITPPRGKWELCMTLNDSWGYQHKDENYKSTRQIVRIFTECVGRGGNLLLDVGPKEDGTFDPRVESTLRELGDWVHKNDEAIFATDKGLPDSLFYGASTLAKDKKTLYLFFYDIPYDQLALKGICTDIKRISILSTGEELTYKKIGGFGHIPGIYWIDFPREKVDPLATVLKVEFDEELEIYTGVGSGGAQDE